MSIIIILWIDSIHILRRYKIIDITHDLTYVSNISNKCTHLNCFIKIRSLIIAKATVKIPKSGQKSGSEERTSVGRSLINLEGGPLIIGYLVVEVGRVNTG